MISFDIDGTKPKPLLLIPLQPIKYYEAVLDTFEDGSWTTYTEHFA
jgi:hypothetical protein